MANSSQIWGHFYRPAALLRVTGGDAAEFLQGQFTNDLRSTRSAPAVYGLWLNHKGRVQADSFVLRRTENEFLAGSYFSPGAVIRERLEAFIVADDVAVADETEHWSGAVIGGGDAAQALAELGLLPPAGGEYADANGGVIWRGRRTRAESFEWIFPAVKSAEIAARLTAAVTARGGEIRDAEAMARERIRAGIPAVPADIGPGELPNEGGLETDAICHTKGCYLGQEVMARLKSLGRVRRRLRRVRGPGAAPATPAAVFQGDKKSGELRSAARDGADFTGLALLPALAPDPAAGFSLEPGGPERLRLEPEAS